MFCYTYSFDDTAVTHAESLDGLKFQAKFGTFTPPPPVVKYASNKRALRYLHDTCKALLSEEHGSGVGVMQVRELELLAPSTGG